MTGKQARHEQILRAIQTEPIGTQEALMQALKASGVEATQSTLSKDLKEMGIVKAPVSGGFRYSVPSHGPAALDGELLLHRELTDFVVAIDGAGHTLVLKTVTGHAQGVCEAIDRTEWPEVVGTLAGDNTIFMLCRTEDAREAVRTRIERIRG